MNFTRTLSLFVTLFAGFGVAELNSAQLCSITKLGSSSHSSDSSTKLEKQHTVTPESSVANTVDPKTESAQQETALASTQPTSLAFEQEHKQKVAASYTERSTTASPERNLILRAQKYEKEKKAFAAFLCYEKAANLYQNSQAQFKVGVCYLSGIIVPFARAKGFKLLEQSAKQSNPYAMLRLAYLLQNGIGVAESVLIEYRDSQGEPLAYAVSSETVENRALTKELLEAAYAQLGQKKSQQLLDKFRQEKFGQQGKERLTIQCANNTDVLCPLCDKPFSVGIMVSVCDCCHKVFHDGCLEHRKEIYQNKDHDLTGIDASGCPGWCYNYTWPLLHGIAQEATTLTKS